ncbi:MAG: YwqG family protein [Bacteroidota bacterium]
MSTNDPDKKILDIVENTVSEPYVSWLKNNILPAISIRTVDTSASVGIKSKFGGIPALRKESQWPVNRDGTPLWFLAEIHTTEIPEGQISSLFPKGILLFFYDYEYIDAQVVFFEEDTVRVTAPLAKKVTNYPLNILPIWQREATVKLFHQAPISFEEIKTLPLYNSLHFAKIHKEYPDALRPSFSIRNPQYLEGILRHGTSTSGHQILGYYRGIQSESLESHLQNERVRHPEELSIAEIESYLQWKLLLTINTEEDIGFVWGDHGKLHFFIHYQDLLNHDFTNVKVYFDTT